MIRKNIQYYCKFCNKETFGEELYTQGDYTKLCYLLLFLCFIIPGLIAIQSNKFRDKRVFCTNCGAQIIKEKYIII